MLFNKRGSLVGAVLAVTIGILVIHVNFVIFQGLFDAIVRDLTDYRFGNLQITDEEDYIDKSDQSLVNWFERIPYVEAATPRLESTASINITKFGKRIEETRVSIVGVDPLRDIRASTVHDTVTEGQFVYSRNSIVLGSNVALDLGGAQVGDSVKLNDPTKATEVKDLFLRTFPNEDFKAETLEEVAEAQLAGFRSGIAMINMIGYFGMMSSAFAIVTIQMMLVNGKTKEIGIMRAIGAKRRDILIIFLFQGIIIGAIGATVGTAAGLGYTIYAKETKMSFNNSLPLEVSIQWDKVIQTALISFSLAIIASLYPSYRATKLFPVEAMRNV